ncbi:hypothetical protein Acr_14g0003120 [Actinidia rufa]|uniref:Uncharacterized protein n=1 Tax=Actinidia rufa TaxID=165716 RepID=A0A7J0FQL4_9ERIC|nr:hypothetical protein Acr_14g0003120 [Actinidia rufa]
MGSASECSAQSEIGGPLTCSLHLPCDWGSDFPVLSVVGHRSGCVTPATGDSRRVSLSRFVLMAAMVSDSMNAAFPNSIGIGEEEPCKRYGEKWDEPEGEEDYGVVLGRIVRLDFWIRNSRDSLGTEFAERREGSRILQDLSNAKVPEELKIGLIMPVCRRYMEVYVLYQRCSFGFAILLFHWVFAQGLEFYRFNSCA